MDATWTKPNTDKPPLHTQMLVALKEGAGGSGAVLDVACYTGLPEDEQGAWIGTGGRFYTTQIAGWMTVRGMAEVNRLHRRLAELEAEVA